MAEVSIIGAGVVGLCVANELLARNVKVSIYDKKTEAGPHACSWWAGGCSHPFVSLRVLKRKFADLVRRLRHGGPNERT